MRNFFSGGGPCPRHSGRFRRQLSFGVPRHLPAPAGSSHGQELQLCRVSGETEGVHLPGMPMVLVPDQQVHRRPGFLVCYSGNSQTYRPPVEDNRIRCQATGPCLSFKQVHYVTPGVGVRQDNGYQFIGLKRGKRGALHLPGSS
jgi:hypothetical protein